MAAYTQTQSRSPPFVISTPTRQPNDSQVSPPTTLLQCKANSKTSSCSDPPPGFALPENPTNLVPCNLYRHVRCDQHTPFVGNLYFLQFPVLACGGLVPVPVPPAAPGRSLLLTPLLARRLRKSPTRGHQYSHQFRPSQSVQNRMSTLAGADIGLCLHIRTMLTTTRRTSATSSIPAARPISGRLRVRYVSVSFLIAHRGALSTTSLSKP